MYQRTAETHVATPCQLGGMSLFKTTLMEPILLQFQHCNILSLFVTSIHSIFPDTFDKYIMHRFNFYAHLKQVNTHRVLKGHTTTY